MKPHEPTPDERGATVRIDAEPSGKKFQGVWLEFHDGKRWVIDYRPREVWKPFEDHAVLVTGGCYRPFGQAINSTHFRVERMRFAGPRKHSTPIVEVGPELLLDGAFADEGFAPGSKRAGDSFRVFDATGTRYLIFGTVEKPVTLGERVRVLARRVEQDRAYAAGPTGEMLWISDVRAADYAPSAEHGPRDVPCPE